MQERLIIRTTHAVVGERGFCLWVHRLMLGLSGGEVWAPARASGECCCGGKLVQVFTLVETKGGAPSKVGAGVVVNDKNVSGATGGTISQKQDQVVHQGSQV